MTSGIKPMTIQALGMIFLAASVTTTAIAQNGKPDPSAEPMPLCTVLANASTYDGKEITVRGLHYRVIHGSILRGPTCDGKANLRLSQDWKADKQTIKLHNSRSRHDQATEIALRGTFRVAQQGQCFGQTCSPYEIEEHMLLSAKIPDK
jgi:hypothetical protein